MEHHIWDSDRSIWNNTDPGLGRKTLSNGNNNRLHQGQNWEKHIYIYIYIWEQIIQHYIWNDWLKIEKQPLIWDNLQAEV